MKNFLMTILLISSDSAFATITDLASSKKMIDLAFQYIPDGYASKIVGAEIVESGVIVKFINLNAECKVQLIPVKISEDGQTYTLESSLPPAKNCK